MGVINLLTKLNINPSATITFENLTTFPSNPVEGQLCYKQQILYIFSLINNVQQWFPLTNIAEKYVHAQGVKSQNWIIEHNLNAPNIIFMVYTLSGQILLPAVNNNEANVLNLQFTEPENGRCIIFCARSQNLEFAIGDLFTKTTDNNILLAPGDLLPGDPSYGLGDQYNSWGSLYLTDNSLHIGSLTFTGNSMIISPVDSPTSADQMPNFTTSKINLSSFIYNSGLDSVAPTLNFNAPVNISTGSSDNSNLTINATNTIFNSSNFSIDNNGNLNCSKLSIIVDGGIW